MARSHSLRGSNYARKTLTYVTSVSDTADATTYTFTAASIGAATADRVIVVGCGGSIVASRTISSVTLGGNAMTAVTTTAAGDSPTGIYSLVVPSGTTATIVVTFSGGVSRCGISIWSLTGWGNVNTYAYNADTQNTVSTLSVTANEPEYGAVIGFATSFQTGGINRTYSSNTNLGTVDNDTQLETATRLVSTSRKWTSLGSAVSHGITFSGNTYIGLCVAVFL
jgi:hypothetical protein